MKNIKKFYFGVSLLAIIFGSMLVIQTNNSKSIIDVGLSYLILTLGFIGVYNDYLEIKEKLENNEEERLTMSKIFWSHYNLGKDGKDIDQKKVKEMFLDYEGTVDDFVNEFKKKFNFSNGEAIIVKGMIEGNENKECCKICDRRFTTENEDGFYCSCIRACISEEDLNTHICDKYEPIPDSKKKNNYREINPSNIEKNIQCDKMEIIK